MKKAEFDQFADEYDATHSENIRISGESPEYFAEYKIADIAREAVGLGPDVRILDFGAGIGNSVRHVKKYFPKAALTCLDVSHRSLDIARRRFPGLANYEAFDGEYIPHADGEFDIAFAACVFHHIDGSRHMHYLEQLNRVLRPGGRLFVFEHNPLNPLTRNAVDTCPFDENAVLINARQMRELFRKAKFDEVTLQYRVFFPGFMRWFRPLERALTRLPLGAQYFVCGQKPLQ